jgi:light-regulated signal transduction histidine kinase (bacteriophytochrome)
VGQVELYRLRFSLAELVKEAVQELRHQTEGRRIEWKIGPLPEVVGDPSLLGLALHNLIENALKFTHCRPVAQIQITSTLTEREAIIAVADNGIGFDARHRAKLFGIFQRLHTSAQHAGLGIGLANVRRIVQRHGGRTWAEGTIDYGATFYLALPRPPAQPESESTAPSD